MYSCFAYFLLTNAYSQDLPCKGADGDIHPNGGGFVASSASVAATVFVGSDAQVCDSATVSENAKILDKSIVSNKAKNIW